MKSLKRVILFLILITTFTQGKGKLTFEFNYARFKLDSVNTYLEIYYLFHQKDLTEFTAQNNSQKIGAIMHIQILDSLQHYVVNYKFKILSPFRKMISSQKLRNIIGAIGFDVPKGKYILTITATDLGDTTRQKDYSEKIKVHPFHNNIISVSDIEMCSNIRSSNNKKSIFFKNNYEVVPNPSLIYSSKMPVLFYYTELYNLLEDHYKSDLVMIKRVLNSHNKVVYQQVKPISRAGNSVVEVGVINLKKFSTGAYTLIVGLSDTSKGIGSAATQQFYYYNPTKLDTSGNAMLSKQPYLSSEYGVMSEDDCDLLFDECKYIANKNEKKMYAHLKTLDAKRKFLYNFWLRRDPDLSTPVNEFKKDYLKRIKYVNEHFSTLNKIGYKTDRGRVYLIYGPYDEIDRYPSEANRKPYEIWRYNSIEGGVIFVFGDLGGYGDYELLHSTKKGEYHDYNWKRRIISNAEGE